jgi:hypothetical protein
MPLMIDDVDGWISALVPMVTHHKKVGIVKARDELLVEQRAIVEEYYEEGKSFSACRRRLVKVMGLQLEA